MARTRNYSRSRIAKQQPHLNWRARFYGIACRNWLMRWSLRDILRRENRGLKKTGGKMPQTLKDLLNESFERHADRTAVRVLRRPAQPDGRRLQYMPLTYLQLKAQRDRLASGLAQLGLEKGRRLGLFDRWRSGVCTGLSILRYARIIGSADLQQIARRFADTQHQPFGHCLFIHRCKKSGTRRARAWATEQSTPDRLDRRAYRWRALIF